MRAHAHTLTVSRTARYFALGDMNENTRRVWIVLHGYGQLAEYFVRKFEKIQDNETYIVAPEALSRFYLDGNSGRVGASWMTREERLSEIDDYVGYLNKLSETIFENVERTHIHLTVLGFSQGTATVCRWLNQSTCGCDRVILWAGYFANGLAELIDPERLPPAESHFLYGDQDEYLNQLNPAEYRDKIQTEVPFLQITEFAGGHTIDTDVLVQYFGPR